MILKSSKDPLKDLCQDAPSLLRGAAQSESASLVAAPVSCQDLPYLLRSLKVWRWSDLSEPSEAVLGSNTSFIRCLQASLGPSTPAPSSGALDSSTSARGAPFKTMIFGRCQASCAWDSQPPHHPWRTWSRRRWHKALHGWAWRSRPPVPRVQRYQPQPRSTQAREMLVSVASEASQC